LPTGDFPHDAKVFVSSITRSPFMNSIIYIVGLVVVVVAVLSFFGLR
jgi:small-conductance mechanosensitive channel